jgi:hypothetical protein
LSSEALFLSAMFLDLATYVSLIWLGVMHALDTMICKARYLVASISGRRSKLPLGKEVQTEYSASDEVDFYHTAYLKNIIAPSVLWLSPTRTRYLGSLCFIRQTIIALTLGLTLAIAQW